MAYIGLAKPYIAKLKSQTTSPEGVTTPVYENGFKCGKAVSVNITPNYNEAKLYADNTLDEYVKEFKDGTMKLGTDRLPKEADGVVFSHEVSEDGTTVTYKTGDSANWCGVGVYIDEILDGVKQYVAIVVFKTKFTEAAMDYETKGENITFKTPSMEGSISALDDTRWKITKTFNKESEAEAFIKTTLNITD